MKKLSLIRSLLISAAIFTSSLSITSCDNTTDGPAGAYADNGVFVVNEGNFGTPNGSVSYYKKDSKEVVHGIFSKENDKRPLGDVVQSMATYGTRAFIVANNSNKIEVVNAATFKSEGVIEGLSAPRYFAALNNEKGYVTEWLPAKPDWSYGKGRVSVIDLKTFNVLKRIELGVQPEQLLISGGKVYVTNMGGNTVAVINTATDVIEKNISVTFGPNSLVLDNTNTLWVLSSGNKDWNLPESQYTAGALSKINTATGTVTSTLTLPKATALANQLVASKSKDALYYNYDGKVYKQNTAAATLSHTLLLNKSYYGLGVDPATGNIYTGDANNFSGDGTVFIYQPDGTQVSSFKTGIAPNGFVFN